MHMHRGLRLPCWQEKAASVLLWLFAFSLHSGPTLGGVHSQAAVQPSHFSKAFQGVKTEGLIKDQRLWKFKGMTSNGYGSYGAVYLVICANFVRVTLPTVIAAFGRPVIESCSGTIVDRGSPCSYREVCTRGVQVLFYDHYHELWSWMHGGIPKK
jgi:hypothetical protein